MVYPDRKRQPDIVPITITDLPEHEIVTLDNGIPLYLFNAGSEDIMRLEFFFNAGIIAEEKPLLASTVNMMLFEGTESFTAAEISKRLDFLGSQPSNFIEKDSAGVSILFLNRYLDELMPLLLEILFFPSFPGDELVSLMKKRLQWFNVNREKVSVIASDRFSELLFGEDHPYGRRSRTKDFKSIRREMLVNFHSANYMPGNMTIFAAGKVEKGSIEIINRYFGKIPVGGPRLQSLQQGLEEAKSHTDRIIKKDAIQSAIRIGSRTIDKRHPDYFGLKIVDTILGGYFGSRLMKNIREEKGYTYGIHSTVKSFAHSGYKSISAEVGADHTREAIDEIYKEIRMLQEKPVPGSELRAVKNYLLGELVRMFDGPFATVESFRSAWEFGLDNSYYMKFAEIINSIDSDEIIRISQTYYRIDDLTEVIAGP